MIRTTNIVLNLAVLMVFSGLSATPPEKIDNRLIMDAVFDYYQQSFGVERERLNIEFVRLPNLTRIDSPANKVLIKSQRSQPETGYQTLWAEIYLGNDLLKKCALSVKVSLTMRVVVAAVQLDRGQQLTADLLRLEERLLDREYGTHLTEIEAACGLVARQLIRPGTVLETDLIRRAPDVLRGSDLEVQLLAGGLVVSTAGVAKAEGNVGEKIAVFCPATRKILAGTIIASDRVWVQ
ncbi:MAG: flagellar basal body P-ring formation chaperone FlgA [Candidatus Neomarinimicrobiota bacterium]